MKGCQEGEAEMLFLLALSICGMAADLLVSFLIYKAARWSWAVFPLWWFIKLYAWAGIFFLALTLG